MKKIYNNDQDKKKGWQMVKIINRESQTNKQSNKQIKVEQSRRIVKEITRDGALLIYIIVLK